MSEEYESVNWCEASEMADMAMGVGFWMIQEARAKRNLEYEQRQLAARLKKIDREINIIKKLPELVSHFGCKDCGKAVSEILDAQHGLELLRAGAKSNVTLFKNEIMEYQGYQRIERQK